MTDLNINTNQLDYMKHAIGYERSKVRKGKYKLYRNYFCSGEEKDPLWEDLINKKYATKQSQGNYYYYSVSQDGLRLIENILDIKIIVINY